MPIHSLIDAADGGQQRVQEAADAVAAATRDVASAAQNLAKVKVALEEASTSVDSAAPVDTDERSKRGPHE
jgi:hypothetical protein